MPAIRDSTLTFIHHLDQNIPYLSEGQGFNIILIKSLASVTTAKEGKENSRICNKHRNNLRNDIKEKGVQKNFDERMERPKQRVHMLVQLSLNV